MLQLLFVEIQHQHGTGTNTSDTYWTEMLPQARLCQPHVFLLRTVTGDTFTLFLVSDALPVNEYCLSLLRQEVIDISFFYPSVLLASF